MHYYDGVLVDVAFFSENVAIKGIVPPSNPLDSICQVHAQFCTGALQQYESMSECQQFLGTLPLGSTDRGAANSVACRNVHAGLVAFRPDIHCSHIGKTGGGKCTDVDYDAYLSFTVPPSVATEIRSIFGPGQASPAMSELAKR